MEFWALLGLVIAAVYLAIAACTGELKEYRGLKDGGWISWLGVAGLSAFAGPVAIVVAPMGALMFLEKPSATTD